MLPVRVAAFVGREDERATVGRLVRDTRVVTLTGPGGCGKTRLAAEVVGDVASQFADGVCWVDLQGVAEPVMVAAAVTTAAGVRERPGQPSSDALAEQLRGRELLVVVDNCEHLVSGCAVLIGELAHACPTLHVLATSRVPLAIEGEATFGVGPLPVPAPHARSAVQVSRADAARLFELRARQVRAQFRIDDANASAVAGICRRLTGIPLAIELAAARVRVLSPAQIEAALSDRFALLTDGPRGAPARQQTLKASFDWSYELLTQPQRLALARVSVFAGSFELDAAEAVVAGAGIAGGDVLDLVAGLADHSLLQVTERHGRARYRLLDTIQAYARQRLHELDDPDRVRARHLQFHIDLAGRAHEGLTGGRPGPWTARLTADLDDLRAAMDWAAESGDLTALVDLTEPIVRFWFERGSSWNVHRRLGDAAQASGARDDDRARGLMTAAPLALAACELATAHRSASRAVAAARAVGRVDLLAVGLGHRAWSGAMSGRSTSAQVDADVEQAIHHARRSGDAAILVNALGFCGAALLHSRSIDDAWHLTDQAAEICEANRLAFQLPAVLATPVAWSVWSGQLDRTRVDAQRAVERSRQVGRPGWEAVGLTGLGAVAVLRGEHRRARARLSDADEVLRARALDGSLYGMWLRHWVALSAYASGDVETALATATEIASIGHGGGSRWDEAMGEWLCGVLARHQGRHDDARAHLEASRALSADPLLSLPLGRSVIELAQLRAEAEDLDPAWELAHRGLEVLDSYGDRVGSATALVVIADLSVTLGHPERALRLLAAADRFHAATGIVRFPGEAERFRRACHAARATVDAAVEAACWDDGGELCLEDAVAYARRGRGMRQRPQIGWASLTPAELDVVALVAAGHTNAEIGARLFISVNTVKKHLSRVYAKTDVGGRAALAAEAARHDH